MKTDWKDFVAEYFANLPEGFRYTYTLVPWLCKGDDFRQLDRKEAAMLAWNDGYGEGRQDN